MKESIKEIAWDVNLCLRIWSSFCYKYIWEQFFKNSASCPTLLSTISVVSVLQFTAERTESLVDCGICLRIPPLVLNVFKNSASYTEYILDFRLLPWIYLSIPPLFLNIFKNSALVLNVLKIPPLVLNVLKNSDSRPECI